MKLLQNLIILCVLVTSHSAFADVETAKELVNRYATISKMQDQNYPGVSADEGKIFFNRKVIQFRSSNKQNKAIACASCHTSNPKDVGKHIVTGKKILPLSPLANPKRFSDIEKVEKQFDKHCNEVVGSDCSAQEKANYIAYLIKE